MCCDSEKGDRGGEHSSRSWQGDCECGCCGCRCGCGDRSHGFRRRFVSRAEKVECLEQYLAQLEAEVIGVKEQIAELKT